MSAEPREAPRKQDLARPPFAAMMERRMRRLPNISRTKAGQAVETIFESSKQALGLNQRIELRPFGAFSVKPRKTGATQPA